MASGPSATGLEQILATVRQRVEHARAELPLTEMRTRAEKASHRPRGFRAALQAKAPAGTAVIAELKKASPSRGQLRGTYPVGGLAHQYAAAGAAALSVLTEESYFQGDLQHLMEASAATELPCLRKDFIIDEYQVYESRAHNADCILLIVSALPDSRLKDFYSTARGLGLDVLVEVHDASEAQRAAELGADLIGVNSRDLRTLQVNMETHTQLAPLLPSGALKVAESGIRTGADIKRLRAAGFSAFLIGETFMAAGEPGSALAALLSESR